MARTKLEGSARERLLAAANELFYEEGVHTVGIDRVIERAGVAKASLYSTFGSKDELVRAYLAGRAETRRQRIAERVARHTDPRDQILAVFDYLAESARLPSFRGCAFINASAEGPRTDKVTAVCADHRGWLRGLLAQLARDAGVADPDRLARQLAMLYDGGVVGAAMDHDPDAPARAKEMAEALIDAAPKKKAKR